MPDNLVYFVIGGENKEYISLLRFAINTILCYPENRDIVDVMVMCDSTYEDQVKQLPIKHVHLTKNNISHVHASMRKTEVFDFMHIHDYKKILYLDCDIVISGSLKPIFDTLSTPEQLYVVAEDMHDPTTHLLHFFHCKENCYDSNMIERFRKNKIFPFNTGQFAFINTPGMQAHFDVIRKRIENCYDPSLHFYEQSFMNDHFNRLDTQCVDYSLTDHTNLIFVYVESSYPRRTINHFLNVKADHDTKLDLMRKSHHILATSWPVPVLDSRDSLHLLVGNGKRIAEIGTFKGDFAQTLYDTTSPVEMYLIDPWDGDIVSGDRDGNNVELYKGNDLFQHVCHRFADKKHVSILRKFSTELTETDIAKKSLDMVYIDGDHSYAGVKRDLEIVLKLVKAGGWICGHDYAMNSLKTKHMYDFGVKKAVDEFCAHHGFRIHTLMLDGCISFAIRL